MKNSSKKFKPSKNINYNIYSPWSAKAYREPIKSLLESTCYCYKSSTMLHILYMILLLQRKNINPTKIDQNFSMQKHRLNIHVGVISKKFYQRTVFSRPIYHCYLNTTVSNIFAIYSKSKIHIPFCLQYTIVSDLGIFFTPNLMGGKLNLPDFVVFVYRSHGISISLNIYFVNV